VCILNPSLGDELALMITERLNDQSFRGSNGTELKFLVMTRGRQVEIGSRVRVWILRAPGDGSFVTSMDGFGRLAISERMRPRYRNAVEQGLHYLKTGLVSDKSALSELKGMLREDQWDWFTVAKLFGFPNSRFLERAVSNAGTAVL
jgi:hypothetical protein